MRNFFFFGSAFVVLMVWLVLLGCSSSNQRDTKFQQYYVSGEQLYVQHCSNCHQKNGSGLGLVYPPLAKSDYMEQNVEQVLCLMKYGQAGEISVNGNVYNKEMKGIFSLTDLEVAEIATYIYNTWQHEKGMIDISDVTKAHQKCDH
jgi:cytochrome c551